MTMRGVRVGAGGIRGELLLVLIRTREGAMTGDGVVTVRVRADTILAVTLLDQPTGVIARDIRALVRIVGRVVGRASFLISDLGIVARFMKWWPRQW